MLSHTAAKDRVIRLIQYLMKFLSYSLSLQAAAKARRLELLLVDARKVFRFLRFLESSVNIRKLVSSTTSTPSNGTCKAHECTLQTLQIVQQGGLCGFFLSDHALLLSKLSITKQDPVFLRQVFGSMWLVSCVSGAAADLLRLQTLSGELMVSGDNTLHLNPHYPDSRQEATQCAQLENKIDLILNSLNALIALNLTTKDMPCNRGVLGVCGVITSAMQLWQIHSSHVSGVGLGQRLNGPVL